MHETKEEGYALISAAETCMLAQSVVNMPQDEDAHAGLICINGRPFFALRGVWIGESRATELCTFGTDHCRTLGVHRGGSALRRAGHHALVARARRVGHRLPPHGPGQL